MAINRWSINNLKVQFSHLIFAEISIEIVRILLLKILALGYEKLIIVVKRYSTALLESSPWIY